MSFPALPSLTPDLVEIILDGPGASTPDGAPPNFINPPDLAVPAVITTGIAFSLASISLILRSYTKHVLMKERHREDYCLILAWVTYIGLLVIVVKASVLASNAHLYNTKVRDVFELLYWANLGSTEYDATIMLLKISILLQYLRVFAPQRKVRPRVFYSSWAVLASCVIFYVVAGFFTIFQCSPREAIWNLLLPQKCFNIDALFLANAAFNLISDIIILALPQYCIWQLQLPKTNKIGISLIFGLGGMACIATALRLYYSVLLVQTHDVTWYIAAITMTADAEIGIGFICCTLPVMPRLVQEIRGKFSALDSSTRARPGSGLSTAPTLRPNVAQAGGALVSTHSISEDPELGEHEAWSSTPSYDDASKLETDSHAHAEERNMITKAAQLGYGDDVLR